MRIMVAMSGGVDSAVAAYLLHRAGHEVVGATLRLFCYERGEVPDRPCCDENAVLEARWSAERISIPHMVIDFKETFHREVVEDFVSEYGSARTPNPCIRCNTHVKFGPLLERAERIGFDAVATGHYARRDRPPPSEMGWALYRARDRSKDQSYVLWGVRADHLDKCLFPLGRARKAAVRRLARRLGLRSWDRPESQDICFAPTEGHLAFLAERLPEDHPMRRPGPVRHSATGAVVGEHAGLLGMTVGMRHGLPRGGPGRLYVVRLDPGSRTLWVGPREACRERGLIADQTNLLAPREVVEGEGVRAQIRYRHDAVPCSVRVTGDRWEVVFDESEVGVAPGQSVVLYRDERVLGGGRIVGALSARD
ncbi:MAG: tRNA 2-thiouridine(34) synthase MnmA [Candidatus Eisenbacteria bacterium]|nr:tRNA 2-thiouridine(34) synthase MnmA [Candidatus Eisenbacteria bacterium]